MLLQFIVITFFFGLVFPDNVYAYLDPGSGSLLVQVLIGAVLGSIYFIKVYWTKLSRFVTSFFERNNDEKKKIDKTK